MTELSIDTKKKKARVRLELLGETEPIEIEVVRYSLKAKGDEAQLTIEEINPPANGSPSPSAASQSAARSPCQPPPAPSSSS